MLRARTRAGAPRSTLARVKAVTLTPGPHSRLPPASIGAHTGPMVPQALAVMSDILTQRGTAVGPAGRAARGPDEPPPPCVKH